MGDLVCRERRGFQRVYDLAERAIPAALRAERLSDEECAVRWSPRPGARSAWARVGDLAVYHGCPSAGAQVLPGTGLVPVRVQGWKPLAYADPPPSAHLRRRAKGSSVLLSPFDSLCWYRDRLERLFGLRHRLEAYTPRAQRTYGYFAMPVLGDAEIVGLVDPGRRDGALVAKQVTLIQAEGAGHVAAALAAAARWVGCDGVVVERVAPRRPDRALEALRRRGPGGPG